MLCFSNTVEQILLLSLLFSLRPLPTLQLHCCFWNTSLLYIESVSFFLLNENIYMYIYKLIPVSIAVLRYPTPSCCLKLTSCLLLLHSSYSDLLSLPWLFHSLFWLKNRACSISKILPTPLYIFHTTCMRPSQKVYQVGPLMLFLAPFLLISVIALIIIWISFFCFCVCVCVYLAIQLKYQ